MKNHIMSTFTIILISGLLLGNLTIIPVFSQSVLSNHQHQGDFFAHDYDFSLPNQASDDLVFNQLFLQDAQPDRQPSRSTGSPDEFGYTYDDTEPYAWIDAAALGVDLELPSGDSGAISDAIDIGFSFPFYENVYSQILITTHGWVTFEPLPPDYWGFGPPSTFISPKIPNNLIATYWSNFYVDYDPYNEGAIFTYQGGSEPDRFFVVEWHEISKYSYDLYTFQLVLHENGEIVMQYKTIPTNGYFGALGIEDCRGIDGLSYQPFFTNNVPEGTAIKFTPPDPERRLTLLPLFQGSLAETISKDYELQLINTGTLGTDTFTLTSESTWQITIYEEDGETEITGPISLAQGQTKTMLVRVQTPESAEIADQNTAEITYTSSDPTKSKTATIFNTIPSRFAQSFVLSPGLKASFLLVTPEQQTNITMQGYQTPYTMAIQELPNGNLLYAWDAYGEVTNNLGVNIIGGMIWYAIIDRQGAVVLPPTQLSTMKDVTSEDCIDGAARDNIPYLALAPNGEVAILWNRLLTNDEYKNNNNLILSIINLDGDIVVDEQNLTQLGDYFSWSEDGFIDFNEFRVVATGEGIYAIACIKENRIGGVMIRNIEYAILDHHGEFIKTFTELDIGSYNSISFLSLCALMDNNLFIAGSKDQDTFYVVINSDGVMIKEIELLPGKIFFTPDSTQLSDGTIVFVGHWFYGVIYVLIDETSYEPITSVTELTNPPGITYADNPSVTRDAAGNAILTWRGGPQLDMINGQLLYALISRDAVLTAPTYAYNPNSQSSDPKYLITSYKGQSNTTYHEFFPPFFTSEPQTAATQDIAYSYAISADDHDLDYGDTLTFSTKNPLPTWLTLTDNQDGTATLSGTPGNNDVGNLEVELVVTDDGGLTDNQAFTLTIANVNDPPFFNSSPNTTAREGELYEYAVSADDPDLMHGDSITIEVTPPLPDWLTLTDHGAGSATLSGTPGHEDGGPHLITLTVTDLAEESDKQSFTINVEIGVAPAFTSDPSAIFSVGKSGSVIITATGNPTPEITLNITSDPVPDGLAFTPGTGSTTLSGIPAAGTGGEYALVFLASNGINPPATQSFTLTIQEAPAISSGNTSSFTVGQPIEFDITATGYPSPAIALDVISDPLPDDVVFTPGTGSATLTGTPLAGTGGIYHLVFTASNSILPDAFQPFTMIIETVEEIGSEGGAISSNNDTITIEVPAGAVSEEIIFTFLPQPEPTESAGNLAFAGISFQLSAKEKISGELVNTFEEPLVVTVYYDEEALGDINEETLVLYYWDEDLEVWVDAICPDAEYERNIEENWFRLSICHLTEFAVLGQAGYQTFLPLMMR